MEYLKYSGGMNKFRNRLMVNIHNMAFWDVDGTPYHIDEMGKASRPVENYALEIDSFENHDGQRIIFYTNPKEPSVLIVFNHRQHLERIYTIGKYGYISSDGLDQGIPSKIQSFEQVISAYKNEEITF